MNFVKAVQRDVVRSPLRREFSLQKWHAECERLKEDDIDTNLAIAGELVHTKASLIRQSLRFTSASNLDHTTRLRSLVALANHDAVVVMTRTREHLERTRTTEGTPATPDLRVSLQLPGGGTYSADELLQSTVDAVEVTVRTILKELPPNWHAARFAAVDWDDVAFDLNMGVLYGHIESLWDDCLWNGFEVHRKDKSVLFRPTEMEWLKRLVVSQWRHDNLGLQALMRFHTELRCLPFNLLSNSLGFRRVARIEKQGRKQVFRFAAPPSTKEAVLDLLCPHVHAAETYYEPLLAQERPLLGGASLLDLTRVWATISTIAMLVRERIDFSELAKRGGPHTWAGDLSPVLQLDSLSECVRQSTGVSAIAARATTDFLTYRGCAGQQLWSQPLVPIADGAVTLVIGALISPNLGRLIDLWLRQAGVDLSVRGPAFETSVREELQQWIVRSPVANESAALDRAFTFKPPNSRQEELDVVWRLGKGVFIAEAKCILHPCEAKELATYRQTIVQAAAQISRKCAAIRAEPEAFRTQLEAVGLPIPHDFELFPLVILNRAIYAGFAVDGVPITDMYMIRTFLSGEFTDIAIRNERGNFDKLGTRKLYQGPDDVMSAARAYFAAPPQIESASRIVTRWVPVHGVNEHDWDGVYLSLDVNPDTERLKSQFDQWAKIPGATPRPPAQD